MILFAPYIGVPLYFAFGWRKVLRVPRAGPLSVLPPTGVAVNSEEAAERILLASGLVPPLAGNQVAYLTTGEQAYARIMGGIARAKKGLEISTFILGRDSVAESILEALIAKAKDGVKVRLLLDGFGCFWVKRSWLRRLREAGGEVAFFMPLLHLPFRGYTNLRNHRKILVVDGDKAVVGGMNLSDDYIGPRPRGAMARFLSLRRGSHRGTDTRVSSDPIGNSPRRRSPRRWSRWMYSVEVVAGARPGRVQLVASGPDVAGRHSLRCFSHGSIQRRRADLDHDAIFRCPMMLFAKGLELAAKRGVDVRICLPRISNHRLADFARGRALRQMAAAAAKSFFSAKRCCMRKRSSWTVDVRLYLPPIWICGAFF